MQSTAAATSGSLRPSPAFHSPAPRGLLGDQQLLWGSVAAASGVSLSCPGPLTVLPPGLWSLPPCPWLHLAGPCGWVAETGAVWVREGFTVNMLSSFQ